LFFSFLHNARIAFTTSTSTTTSAATPVAQPVAVAGKSLLIPFAELFSRQSRLRAQQMQKKIMGRKFSFSERKDKKRDTSYEAVNGYNVASFRNY